MSSETSTETVRLKPDATGGGVRLQSDRRSDQSLQPWQFFVLAALACATAVTFVVRGQGLVAVVLLTVLMGATALVGLAVLKTIRPLVSDREDRTLMVGDRTRAALEREKMLALRAIKELEFDHSMGKIAAGDFREMEARLRSRAIRLMQQLDAGAGYRERIERDLARRLGEGGERASELKGPTRESQDSSPVRGANLGGTDPSGQPPDSPPVAAQTCAGCSTANDADAKFCKSCGQPL